MKKQLSLTMVLFLFGAEHVHKVNSIKHKIAQHKSSTLLDKIVSKANINALEGAYDVEG
jgi:hypothetical protein